LTQNSQRSSGASRGPRRGGPPGRARAPRKPAGPPVEPLHPTENPPEVESFDEFDLHPTVLDAIAKMGIGKPFPIQALAIEPVLAGRDVIAKAETGTGKTLAFGAPMISKIDSDRVTVLGLVLTPTRELAEQVAAVLEKLGEARNIKVALIVGGEPAGPQVAALQAGAQVVVGTPGRVIDLYEQKFLSFPWTEFVVLDEADEMLEIGFIDDVKKILRFTPDERQTLLFSATFPDTLLRLARDHTRDPAEIATASGLKTVDNIEQVYFTLDDAERPLALIRMIERSAPDDVFLVFCERRTDVERLMRRLERLPYSIKALHGGYDQAARFRVMSSFRTGEVKVLVATDVASRGLDVQHVTRVVNFNVPRSITDYTHRIGRTGRAGREGHAVTLVTHEHMHRWKLLLRDANWEIRQVDAPGAQQRRGRSPRPEAVERSIESRPERAAGRPQRQEEPPEAPRREPHEERREPAPRREEGRAREREPQTQPWTPPQRTNEPVSLPTTRQVRPRDPNDPPRRARLSAEMRGRLEEPRRSGAEREAARDERPRRHARGDTGEGRGELRAGRAEERQRPTREPREESRSERPERTRVDEREAPRIGRRPRRGQKRETEPVERGATPRREARAEPQRSEPQRSAPDRKRPEPEPPSRERPQGGGFGAGV
jgi:ATP-dependent RNA helicase DeaD